MATTKIKSPAFSISLRQQYTLLCDQGRQSESLEERKNTM